jgi:uncharacterized membrane protein YkvA (DUF1232 family)
MRVSQLRKILEESNLSPEQLGNAGGVSGMTLRRWLKRSGATEIPKAYSTALRAGCFELAALGQVNLESAEMQNTLSSVGQGQSEAVLANLGLQGVNFTLDQSPDQMLLCLNQIGISRRVQVDAGEERLSTLKKMGEEWSHRISLLWKVVRSSKISAMDKLVAYGALFYLITPFDLVPDQIPVLGYMDDFLILGIAVTYYSRKFAFLNKP